MTRTKGVLILLVVTIIAAVGGWVAASQIESPAEAAARTQPPEPSPVLVPVDLVELSTDVITRGTGRFGSPQTVSVPLSAVKGEAPQVLTSGPEIGAELEQGAVVFKISGRPVFVIAGEIPSFRDLGPGMRGADIQQLETALALIGYDPGEVDGVFDEATEAAVAEMYAAAGFEPVLLTNSQLTDLRTTASGVIPGSTSSGGIHLPADELLVVASTPVRVSEMFVELGETLDGPVGIVTDASVAIDSSVPIESSGLIREGMAVVIDEPDLGIEATGRVSRVAESPGTNGVDGFHVYFEVRVDGDAANVVNASVRITIPIESTGDPVLVVPISAVSLGADGSSRVERQAGSQLEQVVVELGLSANGLVEVMVIEGNLEVGDLVVVGFE